MIETEDCRIVLVTAPDLETGRALAKSVLEARLAACVNILPGIESLYHWAGRLESGAEVLLLMKTTVARLAALEKRVIADHPYDTPEFVVSRIEAGSERYITWLRESVG